MISELTFAAIDYESAGAAKGKTDVPVQIGMASWSSQAGHHGQFVSFIRADRPITWAAQKVHGITSADLDDAPAYMTLWPQIKSRLQNNIVVAHGYGTEKRYLRSFPAHGFGPWLDTLLISRAAWPELKSHALGNICNHCQLTEKIEALVPGKTWHDALFDATASLILLEHLISEFNLLNSSVELLLYPDISAWHRLRNK